MPSILILYFKEFSPILVDNCPADPSLPNDTFIVNNTSNSTGSVILYRCNPGLNPSAIMSSTCGNDGRWSPQLIGSLNCVIPSGPSKSLANKI